MMFFVSAITMLYAMIISTVVLTVLSNSKIITASNTGIWHLVTFVIISILPVTLIFWAYYCGEQDEKFRTKRDFWTIKK